MKPSSLIGHVSEALDLARNSGHPADSVLKDFFRKRRYLGSKDRRFIADAYYGALRNYRILEYAASMALRNTPDPPAIDPIPSVLLHAAYAARLLHQAPESLEADLAETWETAVPRIACGSYLASVRSVGLPESIREDRSKAIALQHSFPDSVVAEWVRRFGAAEAERLCLALNQPAPITIRVNLLKCSVDECRGALEREGCHCTPGRWSPTALVFDRRVNVHALEAFRRGGFEMQDEGSQILSMLMDPPQGGVVVDACAGGGGKSLHLAALMGNTGTLYASDVDESRLSNMQERITRAGISTVKIIHARIDADSLEHLHGHADAVLVDAPCSGTGAYRRNPGAKMLFREESVDALPSLQQSILGHSALLVKDGGRLVYATCSLLARENEEVVARFLVTHPEFTLIPAGPILAKHGVAIETDPPYLYLLPHRTGTDGFFAAVMQKTPR